MARANRRRRQLVQLGELLPGIIEGCTTAYNKRTMQKDKRASTKQFRAAMALHAPSGMKDTADAFRASSIAPELEVKETAE